MKCSNLARFTLTLGVLLVLCPESGPAADWPQYRGPLRDDVSTETGLLRQWPAEGPPLVWKFEDAGIGYSGPAVVGDRLYTLGGRGEKEFLIALDLKQVSEGTVKQAWAAELGNTFDWKGNNWSAGPGATPTVDGSFVYALGGMGDLVCVQAEDGKEAWRCSLPSQLEAQINPIGGGPKNLGWGFMGSPLVDGDRLVCVPGGPKGTVAALDKRTGKLLWQSAQVTDQAAYTSPMVAEFDGVRQYVVLTNAGVVGIEASTGRLLWNFKREPRYGTEVVNTPIIDGPLVYLTVGAGAGCDLLRIARDGDAFKVESVYANKTMANHHGNCVRVGNHVYGHSQGKGWVCQDFKSGEPAWSERSKLGAGAVTYADGRLYCYGEDDGSVVLIEASPEAWKEAGRFGIPQRSAKRKPQGKIWTPPVVSGGKLYLRDQENLYCFDVRAK